MRLRFSLIFLAASLIPAAMFGQTETRPFMAGLSANFFDYQGPLTGNYGQISTYDPGIAFAAYGYISNSFNYSLNTTFAPEVIYPMNENSFISTSMLDLKGMVRWTILNPEKFFVPYIGTGFGLNTASNNLRLYVPASLGFRLRFTENFGLQWESTWQQSIKAQAFQPVSHMVGFVFALPATRKPTPKPQPKEETTPAVTRLADSDGDGVPDRDDQCPDEKGLHMYLGCPEPESEPSGEIDTTPQVADIVDTQPAQTPTTQPPVTNPNPFTPVPDDKPSGSATAPTVTDAELASLNMELQNIYFENASYELPADASSILDRVAKILRDHPDLDLQVMGHTDNSGSERNNIVLSIQRAYKVKYYLVYDKQIPMARISSDGYSSVEPVGANNTDEGRSMNRRVELQLTRKQTAANFSTSRGDR